MWRTEGVSAEKENHRLYGYDKRGWNHLCGMYCRCERVEAGFYSAYQRLACGFHIWNLKWEVVSQDRKWLLMWGIPTISYVATVRVMMHACMREKEGERQRSSSEPNCWPLKGTPHLSDVDRCGVVSLNYPFLQGGIRSLCNFLHCYMWLIPLTFSPVEFFSCCHIVSTVPFSRDLAEVERGSSLCSQGPMCVSWTM